MVSLSQRSPRRPPRNRCDDPPPLPGPCIAEGCPRRRNIERAIRGNNRGLSDRSNTSIPRPPWQHDEHLHPCRRSESPASGRGPSIPGIRTRVQREKPKYSDSCLHGETFIAVAAMLNKSQFLITRVGNSSRASFSCIFVGGTFKGPFPSLGSIVHREGASHQEKLGEAWLRCHSNLLPNRQAASCNYQACNDIGFLRRVCSLIVLILGFQSLTCLGPWPCLLRGGRNLRANCM